MSRPRKHEEPLTSYTLKLSPKHVFALKIIARTGDTQSESTVLEEAIENIAGGLKLSRRWDAIWDRRPPVAWLNAYALPEYRPITKEQARFDFIAAHREFFYRDKGAMVPNVENATVLWDDLDELVNEWVTKRKTDYWGASKKMAAALKKAQLPSPSFGSAASAKRKASEE